MVLKRKSLALHTSHSRGHDGFSLNGKTRFMGPGESNLAKSVTRTPFKGNEPVGHGGGSRCRFTGIKARACHRGDAYVRVVLNSGSVGIPQTEVKRTTMSNAGMLEQRLMPMRTGKYPCTWVKPQPTNLISAAAAEPFSCPDMLPTIHEDGNCSPYSKPGPQQTYTERNLRLTAQCLNPSCSQRPFPFRMSNLGSCSIRYTTWQAAQASGALCAGFIGP